MAANGKCMDYVLISAARNEEKYIQMTLESVIAQTKKPKKWVIVSDRSTDRTDDIVRCYQKTNDFIELLPITGDSHRNFGSQVRAINRGYELLKGIEYRFIGNLDADISFGVGYFEGLLQKFQENPKLGLGGGFICEKKDGLFVPRSTNNIRSVPHAVQLFRRECFEKIGGYIQLKYGGPDWLAEIMVRMEELEVASFQDLEVHHHRPTTSAEGYLHGAFRCGQMDHSMGSHPLFEIFKCVLRVKSRPFIIGTITRMCGFIYGYIQREPRLVPEDAVKYLRKEQISRVKKIFL